MSNKATQTVAAPAAIGPYSQGIALTDNIDIEDLVLLVSCLLDYTGQ